jgi:GNAT superfamily N-acetyltransferase
VTTIRAAVVDDARAIAEVHVASWRWAYRGQLSDDYLDRLSVGDREVQWTSTLRERKPWAGALVAEDRERILGFASFGRSQDEDASERTSEVFAIYLREDAVGRGIGRDLFGAATDRLREAGFERATLWVLASNERTRRFYEKAGWSWDGTTSDHDFECANLPILRYAVDL